jgi:hypothetical protein
MSLPARSGLSWSQSLFLECTFPGLHLILDGSYSGSHLYLFDIDGDGLSSPRGRHMSLLGWRPSWLISFLTRPSLFFARPSFLLATHTSCLSATESALSNPFNLVNPIPLLTPVVT